jgi:D-aminoacyl-tRNA deacylase
MRAVLQRVTRATVSVDGRPHSGIQAGMLVLLGVEHGDGPAEADRLAAKTARLRVFPDRTGRFDRSLLDTGGAALVVSQFTLLADVARGNRPSFGRAARPDVAEKLVERFCAELREQGLAVETGVFGARMQVELVNDGPVTIVLAEDPPAAQEPEPA